jgi:hypothetical protein
VKELQPPNEKSIAVNNNNNNNNMLKNINNEQFK